MSVFRDPDTLLRELGSERVPPESAEVAAARRERPDLVLMDLNMPGLPGTTAIRRISEELPDTRLLVLSASAEEPDVLEAVKAGAPRPPAPRRTRAALGHAGAQGVPGAPAGLRSPSALR